LVHDQAEGSDINSGGEDTGKTSLEHCAMVDRSIFAASQTLEPGQGDGRPPTSTTGEQISRGFVLTLGWFVPLALPKLEKAL
jgi:hypothetical protein